MLHFPRPKAQSLVLWGAKMCVTCMEEFMSKGSALQRYLELSVYYKCGKTTARWAAKLSVQQRVMASSSIWLNTCLFCSLLGICCRLSSIVQELLWQTQLLLPYCLLGSARTHPVSWFLGVFQWEMQMSFITVIGFFPSHAMKGTLPCHPWGKTVQTHKDFVRIRKYQCLFYIFPLVRACSKGNKA